VRALARNYTDFKFSSSQFRAKVLQKIVHFTQCVVIVVLCVAKISIALKYCVGVV